MNETLSENIYLNELHTIAEIKFTRREIDVMACLIHGRSAKKIASYLSIALKTVENHTHNIMVKIGCNSRESIIDFAEKSNKSTALRAYYTSLRTYISFEKHLKKIIENQEKPTFSCIIVYDDEESSQKPFLNLLVADLTKAGIHVSLKKEMIPFSYTQILQKSSHEDIVIFLLPKSCVETTQNNKAKSTPDDLFESNSTANKAFLILESEPYEALPHHFNQFNIITYTSKKSYYQVVQEILKKFHPKLDIETAFKGFQETLVEISSSEQLKVSEEGKRPTHLFSWLRYTFYQQSKSISISIACISILILGYIGLSLYKDEDGNNSLLPKPNGIKVSAIRSDFVLPKDDFLLKRTDLLEQINSNLNIKDSKGIQTLALTGPGGSGKTTLARQYALSQNSAVVWEMNGETVESLQDSFEQLAQALSSTEEEKTILRNIQQIKNPSEKTDKLILFVKHHLQLYPHWFLVFDNVEKFGDLQKFFPQDSLTWGEGKVLITSRDNHIKDHQHVNYTIQVGELTPDQKLNLFTQIITNGNVSQLLPQKTESTKQFLLHIPPFPLDVLTAANHIKMTKINYDKYIVSIKEYNKDFNELQKIILQEFGDYTKTRYGITTLFLQNLINIHQDFKDLFLLICLLDSQNIPEALLKKFKPDHVVDNFISHLKTQSLITQLPSRDTKSGFVISIHRSVQAIGLAYLTALLNLKENTKPLEPLVQSIENYMDEAINLEDYSRMRLLAMHAEAFLNRPFLNNHMKGIIAGELGGMYTYLGHFSRAKEVFKESFSHLDQANLNYKPHMGRYLSYLGKLHRDLGENEESIKILEHSLSFYQNAHSENDLIHARSLANLGNVYRDVGNYKKAQPLLEKSLTIYKKVLPSSHMIGAVKVFLGNLYVTFGDYKKGIPLLEEGVAIYKNHFSSEHFGIGWAMCHLAVAYIKAGKYDEARPLLERSLSIFQKQSDENAPFYVNWALSQLGMLEAMLGHHEKAITLMEPVEAIYRKIYGPTHIETARLLNDLGQVYFLKGQLESAEQYFEESLKIFQMQHHPELFMAHERFSNLYLQKIKTLPQLDNKVQANELQKKAMSSLKDALKIAKTYFPENSPHIQRIKNKIEHYQEKD